jgi:hypothetical protein
MEELVMDAHDNQKIGIASRTCAVGGPSLIGPVLEISTIGHVERVGIDLPLAFKND